MTRTRTPIARRLAAASVAAALALGTAAALGGASPVAAAQARPTFIATANGLAGVTQVVTIAAPRLVNQVVTVAFASGSTGASLQTVIGPSGYGSLSWTPPSAGTWTLTGVGSLASAAPATVTVAAMPTTTVVEAPNVVGAGQVTNLIVFVKANAGTTPPQGTVTASAVGGNAIGTGGLVPVPNSAIAYATIPWTAPGVGTYAITAGYAPSVPSFQASTSASTGTLVQSSAPSLSLRLPGQFFVNRPVYLTAITSSTQTQGSAAFQLNPMLPNTPNLGITGSMPLVNGAASTPWTPTQQGTQTVIAQFTNSTATASGTASQVIVVQPDPANDAISVAPTGQAPWAQGAPVTLRAGQNLIVGASSASGAPVVLSETGPCVINGSLFMALSPGTCTVTATSPGAGAFDPGTAAYTVVVQPAPRKRAR